MAPGSGSGSGLGLSFERFGVYCLTERRSWGAPGRSSWMPRLNPRMWEAGMVWEVMVQRCSDMMVFCRVKGGTMKS